MSIELRPYQREAVDSIYSYFQNGGTGNPLVVAPTGSGKSIIVAKLMEEVLKTWPEQRMLMLSHRKELLSQNYSKLIHLWPEAPAGVYSAGLNSRRIGKITIAGIASIYKRAAMLGWQDLILIDECHLVNHEAEGMYRKLIDELKLVNRNLRVIGFTATAFRMKTGMLTEPGGLFTDICYDIDLAKLVREGYLAPLISKNPATQADLTNVRIRGGEFVAAEAEDAMDDAALTSAAITEMEHYLKDRKSWILFCAGVAHADHVTKALNERGHPAECVVGDTEDMFRDQILNRFKRGELKCLVNCNVLTTGFDAPNIDALVLLRPTKSIGLYVQMCGRGMRLSPETGKSNCIVLDFAGNIERHGPVDAITIRPKRDRTGLEVASAPVKTCPECNSAVAISVMECPECGYKFPAQPAHDTTATTASIMVTIEPPRKWRVRNVSYRRHEKVGGTPSMRVIYECGDGNITKQFSEWICVEHHGYAYQKAVQWWLTSHPDFKAPNNIVIPNTVEEAIAQSETLRVPSEILVTKDGKFDRIVTRLFNNIIQEEKMDKEDSWPNI